MSLDLWHLDKACNAAEDRAEWERVATPGTYGAQRAASRAKLCGIELLEHLTAAVAGVVGAQRGET